ncbi:uncharacterized protein LOC127804905 [Diospyros lotus]|uniref:uncharacterized protein LOC127804905 n=1 Tax=Diospyros lotus TaxID=55363 RepID=UPI00224F06FA|nr:uncharacterized protein LOC127804905 [Diospyros lotus]
MLSDMQSIILGHPKCFFFYFFFLIWLCSSFSSPRSFWNLKKRLTMNDWAGPIIATALFAFLSPGLIVQMPGKHRPVDFLNMKTSVVSILIHTVLYGLLLILFLVVLNVHFYA